MLVCGHEVEPTENPSGLTIAGLWTNLGEEGRLAILREFCPDDFGLKCSRDTSNCAFDSQCLKCWNKATNEVY